MTGKRFTTNGYYVYDNQKEDKWLANEVEIGYIVTMMNNLDTKAKEKSKALSTLQKKFDALHEENTEYKQELDQFYLLIGRGDWSGLVDLLLVDDEKSKTK